MKHYGDITKLSGYDLPPVDCITGGSPCQDLSVAGKRAGLDGERSGLFMEQIRIVKEMREYDRRTGRTAWMVRPRYMVWENVPGAFSSNGGEDFRVVLEEIARIADKDAVIPRPPKGGWTPSGCIVGDGWSIAWRVHDAQFWGVPQRRKRIALVADFGGLSAPEILFERKGLSGYSAAGFQAWERAARDPETGSGTAGGLCLNDQGGERMDVSRDVTGTLRTQDHGHPPAVVQPVVVNGVLPFDTTQITSPQNGSHPHYGDPCHPLAAGAHPPAVCIGNGQANQLKESDKVRVLNCMHDQQAVMVFGLDRAAYNQGKNAKYDFSVEREKIGAQTAKGPGAVCNVESFAQNQIGEVRTSPVCGTLNTNSNATGRNAPLVYDARGNGDGETAPTITGDHENRITDYTAVCIGNGQANQLKESDKVRVLNCMHDQQAVMVFGLDRAAYNQGKNAKYDFSVEREKIGAQTAKGPGAVCSGVVRRLTPLECERLQGYPDGWTDIGDWTDSKGKNHKATDSARYKALGNSIALPFWFWLLRRISAQYERPATLGSLFDGIGGFPLCWERCNGKGTAVWASEIEEFPIAVTKKHFPELLEEGETT